MAKLPLPPKWRPGIQNHTAHLRKTRQIQSHGEGGGYYGGGYESGGGGEHKKLNYGKIKANKD